MIRFAVLPLACLALAACSQEPADSQESADDFANRIGQSQTVGQQSSGMAANDPAQPDPDAPNVATTTIAQGTDVTQLQQLGDIGGVNLGPRNGGCTFTTGGTEMIVAAGLDDRTLPGKAVVRLGRDLVLLDTPPGGLAAIKSGTSFKGEGVTVQVAPAAGEGQTRPANVTVTAADGKTASYSGNWICA